MNKLVFGIISIFLITCFCCQKNEVTTTFSTDIIGNNNNDKYANVPTNFKISFTQDNKINGKYQLRYFIETGKGELFIKNQKVQEDEETEFSEKELEISYFPLKIGEHRLRFQIIKDGYETETVYAISVQEYSASISPLSIEDIYVNQPVYIDYNLTQKNNNGDFLATLEIIKGHGNVLIIEDPGTKASTDTTIITPILNDTIVSQIKTRSEQHYKVKTGNNRIFFNPDVAGEHIIRLNLTNSYGYKQFFDFKLNVVIPEFSASAENDTCIIFGESGNFILKIQNPIPNELYTIFHFMKNSGKVYINENEITEDKVFTIQSGTYTGKYFPASKGDAAIEFTITDQYNKKKKGTMEFSVVKSLINLTFEKPDKIFSGENTKLKVNINEEGYSGKFYGQITASENINNLLVNGTSTSEKFFFNAGDNTIEFIPSQGGLIQFKFIVSDEKNNYAEGCVEVNVNESIHDIQINNYNPVIKLSESGTINFDIIKLENYTGKYYCEIQQQPAESSTIKINGKEYTSGKVIINKTGNKLIFFPKVSGDISLNLAVYTEDGKTISKTLSFLSSDSELEIQISDYKKNVLTGKQSNFNFSVKKEGYTGLFKYYITSNPNIGTILINGERYFTDQIESISNNSLVSIAFIPVQTGDVTLTLHVLDGIKETTYPLNFEIKNTPIVTDVKDFNETAVIKKENICNISVDKADYNNHFKCLITTQPENAGKIKLDNYINDSNQWDITTGNHSLSFTPRINENIKLRVNIIDIYGGSTNKTLEYHIQKSELNIEPIGSIDASVNLNETGRFNIAVNKANYSGKYFMEVSGNGYRNLKISGQTYSGKTEVTDPDNINISYLASDPEKVEIFLRISDESGATCEKSFLFKVNHSDLLLTLNGILGTVYTGSESVFSFNGNKPGFSGQLKYKIKVTPENAGELYIAGIPYHSDDISEINAGTTTHVVFRALKECTAEIRVSVIDNQSEKSKLFSCKIMNTPVITNVTGFHSAGIVNTENISYLSVPENNYKGKYKLNITSEPNNSGVFRINNNIYDGGEVVLDQPDNTKITFIPHVAGTILTDLKITNEYGASSTQQLEYNITNPELQVTIAELKELIANKEAILNFNVSKPNYTGNLYCEVKSDNISSLKINNIAQNEEKVKIFSGSNNIRFTPTTSGKNAVSLHLLLTDDWGGEVTKDLIFDVNETNTEITLIAERQELYEEEETSFIFTVNKETSEMIGYTLVVEPTQAGIVKPCEGEVKNGIPEYVTFKAKSTGPAIVSVKAGNTEKKLSFNIIKSETDLSFQGFSPTSQANISNKCNFNISRNGYSGTFTGTIQIKPENGGTIRIDGAAYKNEGIKLSTGSHSLEFIPTTSGEVTIFFQVEDDWGDEITKDLVYQVTRSPEDLRVSISGNGQTINLNNEASFTFIPLKTGYSGKYYAELTGNNCRNLNINGTNYESGQRIEIQNTPNTVKFFPEVEGEINVQIKIIDANNNSATGIANFICKNSSLPIDLSVITGETNLVNGETSNFIFTPQGSKDLSYELSVRPINAGKFIIKDKEYSGRTGIESGMSVNVTYIPQQPGNSEVVISLTNPSGERKDKTIKFEVQELSLIIPGLSEWTNGEKVMLIGERSGLQLSSNTSLTCNITDISNQPVKKGQVNFYINGSPKVDNIFTINSTPVKLEIEPLQFGKHDYLLNIGNIKNKLSFNVNAPSPIINIENLEKTITVGNKTKFNLHVSKISGYNEVFSYKIDYLNVLDFQINGKTCLNSIWYDNIKIENLNNLEISFIPSSRILPPVVKFIIKDKNGNETYKEIKMNIPKVEYIEIPCEAILERETANQGKYIFSGSPQYFNYIVGENSQLDLGDFNLILEPNIGNKVSKHLNKIRVFKSEYGQAKLGLISNNTKIEWINSPEQKVEMKYIVLSATNEILDEQPIKKSLGVAGTFTGEKKWEFGSPFEGESFLDWEITKKQGTHVVLKYVLKNTATETSKLQITNSNTDKHNLIVGEEFYFNVNVSETGTYKGNYQLTVYNSSNINSDIRINGKNYDRNKWQPVTLEEIKELKICATPVDLGITTITIGIKDEIGKITTETFEIGKAEREYIEVPAEVVLERQSSNSGTYNYESEIQYLDHTEPKSSKIIIGVTKLKLEAGSSIDRVSQKLNPVKIFRSNTNKGWLEMASNCTTIEWTNSPKQKALYAVEVIDQDGKILTQLPITISDVNGEYSGNKSFIFGSPFKYDSKFSEWSILKQPGVHVRVHYLLENTKDETPLTENFIDIPTLFIMEREKTNDVKYIFNASLDYYNYTDEGTYQNSIGNINLMLDSGSDINQLTHTLSNVRAYKIANNGKIGCGLRSSQIEYKWNGKYPAQKAILLLKVVSENNRILAEKKEEKVITKSNYWIISGSIWSDISIPWNTELKRCHIEISYKIEDIKE